MAHRSANFLIVHHSASPRGTTVETINDWHQDRGYDEIGYHYVIDGDGDILIARSFFIQGAHSPPHNHDSIGVCITGDNRHPDEAWTDIQVSQLQNLYASLKMLFPDIIMIGHRDIGSTPTLCPGVNIEDPELAILKQLPHGDSNGSSGTIV